MILQVTYPTHERDYPMRTSLIGEINEFHVDYDIDFQTVQDEALQAQKEFEELLTIARDASRFAHPRYHWFCDPGLTPQAPVNACRIVTFGNMKQTVVCQMGNAILMTNDGARLQEF